MVDGLPLDLDAICWKAIRKVPAQRYPSAQAVADDLRRWLEHEPITARPMSSWLRALKWARRKPAIAAMSEAVFLVSVLGISGIVWQWRAARVYANKVSETNVALKKATLTARSLAEEATKARDDAKRERDKTNDALEEVSKTNDALKRSELQARQSAYDAHIVLAQREWDAGNVSLARELLNNHDEAEFRGFEWHHLNRRFNPQLLTLKVPYGGCYSAVAFANDGTRLASAGEDGTIKIWDAVTGLVLRSSRGTPAKSLAWHSAPTASASHRWPQIRRSSSGTPRVDRSSERSRRTSDKIHRVAFSRDGKRILTAGGDGTVKLMEADSGREFRHTRWVLRPAYLRGVQPRRKIPRHSE